MSLIRPICTPVCVPVCQPVTDIRVSAAPLSPLQAATLGAWDMQEASGPLVPAAGGITIAAFNSPGTTASGPAVGISARTFVEASSQYFEASDAEVFRAPASGVKVFRFWGLSTEAEPTKFPKFIFKANEATANAAGSEYAFDVGWSTGLHRALVRRADDTARVATQTAFAAVEWRRIEVEFNANTNTVTTRVGGYADLVMVVPSGFFRGANPFRIGRGTTTYSDMQMALLAIFDRALTADERTADATPRLWSDI